MSVINKVVFLSGQMVNLRPIQKSDIPLMTRWINDPEVRQYLASTFPQTEKSEEDWYNKQGNDKQNLTLCIETKDGKPIGVMGAHKIDWINQSCTTGSFIGEKEYWGKGYGTDAKMILLEYLFNILNLRKVKSDVIAFNERSIRYSLRCGYKIEARLQKEKYRNGEFHDLVLLAVFKKDWLEAWKSYQSRSS